MQRYSVSYIPSGCCRSDRWIPSHESTGNTAGECQVEVTGRARTAGVIGEPSLVRRNRSVRMCRDEFCSVWMGESVCRVRAQCFRFHDDANATEGDLIPYSRLA